MFLCEMTRKMVLVDNIEKIKAFVNATNKCPVDVDIATGRYVVDAKSLMGVFSVDVSKPVELRIHNKSNIAAELLDELSEFIVGEAPELTDRYAK